jgi:hypothetical protein
MAIRKIRESQDGESDKKDQDEERKPDRKKIHFWYLRSLCYKVMKQFDKSQKDYRDILRAF